LNQYVALHLNKTAHLHRLAIKAFIRHRVPFVLATDAEPLPMASTAWHHHGHTMPLPRP